MTRDGMDVGDPATCLPESVTTTLHGIQVRGERTCMPCGVIVPTSARTTPARPAHARRTASRRQAPGASWAARCRCDGQRNPWLPSAFGGESPHV